MLKDIFDYIWNINGSNFLLFLLLHSLFLFTILNSTDRKRDESVTDDWDVLRMGALAMLNKVIPSIKETVGSEINKVG